MSFWKTVGDLALKAGKASIEAAKDAQDREENYRETYSDYSDDRLFDEWVKAKKSFSGLKMKVIIDVLKERGYSQEEIKSNISLRYKE